MKSAFTKVCMTFEVTFSQPWSEGCSIAQVRKQTMDQAADVASNLVAHVNRSGLNAGLEFKSLDPNITIIMPEEKR
jgi:hypothetical protein